MVFGKDQVAVGGTPGHAPTNYKGHVATLIGVNGQPNPYRFDQPLGRAARIKGTLMPKTKNKERQCLEAIQNYGGSLSDEVVTKRLADRFPRGMVKRLLALSHVSENPDHKDFLNAQRLVRDILHTMPASELAEQEAASKAATPDRIEVIQCHIDAPMPGAGDAEPGAAHASLHEPPGTHGGSPGG